MKKYVTGPRDEDGFYPIRTGKWKNLDRLIPGVTKVLSASGIADYEGVEEHYCERGSKVHDATELLDRGKLDIKRLPHAISPFCRSWRKIQIETRMEIIAIEQVVVNRLYGYAGRLDRVVRMLIDEPKGQRGTTAIVDLKCGVAPWWIRYQLAGYGAAYNPKRAFARYAVQLDATGKTAKMVEYPIQDYWQDVHDFYAMVRVANVRLRHGQ